MILQNWQAIHIERRELKVGDGNNGMEGDANNRSVCTSCPNDDNENKHGHVSMSIWYYCMQQYSQIRDEIGGSGVHTLMVRDQHHDSSSGPPRRCAMPPMRISGGSEDYMPSLLLRSNCWLGCVPRCQCSLVLLQAMFQCPVHLANVHLGAAAAGDSVDDTSSLL